MKKKKFQHQKIWFTICVGCYKISRKKMASMTLNIFKSLAHTDIKPQKSVFGAFILWGKQNSNQNFLFTKVTIVKYFPTANIL